MAKRFDKAREYTKKYRSSLLPCKYCGNKELYINSDRSIFPPKDVWSVDCIKCGNGVYGKDRVKEAIEIWNINNGERK